MIEEQAEVTDIDGLHAWVACRAQQDCARCAAGNGCGGGILGRWLGDRLHRVRVVHQGEIAVGDCVIIGLDERALLRAAAAIYGIPLLAMLAGAVTGQTLYGHDAAALAGAAAGLAAGFAWVRVFSRKMARYRRFQPAVLRRV
ncbi:MAG: SoxR reducing system RseC family protein [Gammaproteobacteria bacterium]